MNEVADARAQDALASLCSLVADTGAMATHMASAGVARALQAWLEEERLPPSDVPALRVALADLCSALPPPALVALAHCVERELHAAVLHSFGGGGGISGATPRAAVLVCADEHEAQHVALRCALHRRFPLLPVEGARALTRAPVFYGDEQTLEELQSFAVRATGSASSS